MRTRWKQLLVLLTLVVSPVGEALAEWSLDLGVENFRWQEFDAGARLLEETGPRFRVGGTWRQPFGAEQRDLFQLRGAIYLGNVDYDGQTQAGMPFQTDATYAGATVEATYARLFGTQPMGEFFFGGGTDSWRRDIKGSGGVFGAIEDWSVLYAIAGGGANWTGPEANVHARIGVKYPVYTTNVPDAFDVTLKPKGRASLFARVTTDFISAGRPRWGIGAYYDSYRFAMSNMEQTGSFLVWQPESRQDVIGIFASVYFQ
jgi:hypothetical protein